MSPEGELKRLLGAHFVLHDPNANHMEQSSPEDELKRLFNAHFVLHDPQTNHMEQSSREAELAYGAELS